FRRRCFPHRSAARTWRASCPQLNARAWFFRCRADRKKLRKVNDRLQLPGAKAFLAREHAPGRRIPRGNVGACAQPAALRRLPCPNRLLPALQEDLAREKIRYTRDLRITLQPKRTRLYLAPAPRGRVAS